MPKPEKVGSGSFRVDRARALQILAARRFSDPTVFVDCWIRAAEAAGAQALNIHGQGSKSLRLEFCKDVPLPEYFWAPVLDPQPRQAVAHELALGALACLASRPRSLRIVSSATAFDFESVEKVKGEVLPGFGHAPATTITATWDAAPDWPARLDFERFWPLATPVGIGKPFPKQPPFVHLARRGRMRFALAPRPADTAQSRLCAYRLGVLVEKSRVDSAAPVAVHADDAAAELTLGLDHLAAGPRRERLLELAARQVPSLILKVARWQAERFPKVAGMLQRQELSNAWAARSAFLPPGDNLVSAWEKAKGPAASWLPKLSPSERLDFIVTGWATDWLHAADPSGLEDQPLFFSGGGGTATLADLRRELKREGVVRWSREPGSAPVWCPSALEIAWLTRHFGAAFREI